MKKFLFMLAAMFTMAASAVLFTSCGDDDDSSSSMLEKDKIIGTWVSTSTSGYTLVFTSDGKLTVKTSSTSTESTYTINGQELKISLNGVSLNYNMYFTGNDKLHLTYVLSSQASDQLGGDYTRQ